MRLPAKVDGKQQVPTYTVGADNKIEHQIYLFETAQPTGGTAQEQHMTRPCLIVKGVYENAAKPCYYRIDFAKTGTKNYMDIVRNHSYNVTVQNVLAPGHDTPEEALTAQAANITATVVKWNDSDIGDIDFDGQHVLGIATMKYQLGKKGSNNASLLQQVKASVGLKWTANLYAVDDYGKVDTNKQPDWISFEGGGKEASGTGNNQLQDLKFTVARNGDTPERRAVMRFTARNLMVEALVVQDQSSPVYITVKRADGTVVTEAELDQAGGWLAEDLHIEFGPENTELSWKANGLGSITLNNTRVDGAAETTAMNGTATSDPTEEDKTITWNAKAAELVSAADYETRIGVLTLIAKGKAGVVSKSIRLFQKKYGVTLNEDMLVCTGSPEKLLVKGNMNWEVEPVLSSDLEHPDGGYEKAVKDKYMDTYKGPQTGVVSDDYSTTNSVTFEMLTPESTAPGIDMKLRFIDKEKKKSVIKTVKVQPGVVIDNAVYALWGPKKLSMEQYDVVNYKPTDCPLEYRMISENEASHLIKLGFASVLGCNKTKSMFCWEHRSLDASGNPSFHWGDTYAGEVYERANIAWTLQLRRVVKMINVIHSTGSRQTAYLKEMTPISFYWTPGNYMTGFEFIPQSYCVREDADGIQHRSVLSLRVIAKMGGYYNQVNGWMGTKNVLTFTTQGGSIQMLPGIATVNLVFRPADETAPTFVYGDAHLGYWPSFVTNWIWRQGIATPNLQVPSSTSLTGASLGWSDNGDLRTTPLYDTYYIKKIKDLN